MTDQQKKEQEKSDNILIALADIYAFVKASEITKSFASKTFEDYIEEAKNQIKSDAKGTRPTQMVRLDRLKEKVVKVIDQAKNYDLKKNSEEEEVTTV